jgi:hypothetical protein
VKQGLVYELVIAKLIVLNDVGAANCTDLEACVSLIRVNVDAHGDARGLRCHASDLHPQQKIRDNKWSITGWEG